MSCDSRVGRNQFAYRGQRGSRDAIAYLTLKWLDLLRLGNKIAVYLSDVSGAFDKVDSDRLIKKLEHRPRPPPHIHAISGLREQRCCISSSLTSSHWN